MKTNESRLLKNVGEAGKTRQKQARARSLGVLDEQYSLRSSFRAALKRVSRKRLAEPVFNEVLPTQVVFQRAARQRGFTLIEIMVVVVILGILAALVVPQVMNRPDQAKVTVAKGDIKAIGAALDMYKLDNFAYPSTQQGLNALVEKPSGSLQPKNWNRDGYLKRVPKDPWGNDYQYLSPGTQGQFDLYSLGADGKQGGTDLNADIGNWDL